MGKANRYTYKTETGTTAVFFNIYQGKNGFIYLQMGIGHTKLTKSQIEDLGMSLYDIKEFDHDQYLKSYFI